MTDEEIVKELRKIEKNFNNQLEEIKFEYKRKIQEIVDKHNLRLAREK